MASVKRYPRTLLSTPGYAAGLTPPVPPGVLIGDTQPPGVSIGETQVWAWIVKTEGFGSLYQARARPSSCLLIPTPRAACPSSCLFPRAPRPCCVAWRFTRARVSCSLALEMAGKKARFRIYSHSGPDVVSFSFSLLRRVVNLVTIRTAACPVPFSPAERC